MRLSHPVRSNAAMPQRTKRVSLAPGLPPADSEHFPDLLTPSGAPGKAKRRSGWQGSDDAGSVQAQRPSVAGGKLLAPLLLTTLGRRRKSDLCHSATATGFEFGTGADEGEEVTDPFQEERRGTTLRMRQHTQQRDSTLSDPEDGWEAPTTPVGGQQGAATSGPGLSLEQLQCLKGFFDAADLDGEGTLDEDEFVGAFSVIMVGMTRDQLRDWFRRIDANANGSVDWDEFSSYVLLDGQQKTQIEERKAGFCTTCDQPQPPVQSYHQDSISMCLVHPRAPRYFTCGRDGAIKVWNSQTISLEETIRLPTWVLDAKFVNRSARRIITCHTDRSLAIVDTERLDVVRVFTSRKVSEKRWVPVNSQQYSGRPPSPDHASGSLKYVAHARSLGQVETRMQADRERAKRKLNAGVTDLVQCDGLTDYPHCVETIPYTAGAWGNGAGPLAASALPESQFLGVHADDRNLVLAGLGNGDLVLYCLSPDHLSFRQSVLDEVRPLPHLKPLFSWRPLHSSVISCCRWAASIENVVTASWDRRILFINLETCRVSREVGDHGKTHDRDIFGCDWNDPKKVLATFAKENAVLLWNPYIADPIHHLPLNTPVVDAVFNPSEDQLITLTDDKLVRVWDMRAFRCLQTLNQESAHLRHPTRLAFDAGAERLVLCSNFPSTLPMVKALSEFPQDYRGHKHPVIEAVYIPQFEQAVSIDEEVVMTWDVHSGQLVSEFNVSHAMRQAVNHGMITSTLQGTDAAITAVAFDSNGRRIITGMQQGQIFLWNYINGQLLKVCQNGREGQDNAEVIAICYADQGSLESRYVVASIGAIVYVWRDNEVFASKPDRVLRLPPVADLPDCRLLSQSAASETVTCLCFDGPVQRILVGTSIGRLVFYSLKAKNHLGSMLCGPTLAVQIEHVPPAVGPTTVAGDDSGPAYFAAGRRNAVSAERLVVLPGRGAACCALSDGRLVLWDLRKREMLYQWACASTAVTSLSAASDGLSLCVGHDRGNVTRWEIGGVLRWAQAQTGGSDSGEDVPSVELAARFSAHASGAVSAVQLTESPEDPEGYVLLTAGADRRVKLHRIRGGFLGEFGKKEGWRCRGRRRDAIWGVMGPMSHKPLGPRRTYIAPESDSGSESEEDSQFSREANSTKPARSALHLPLLSPPHAGRSEPNCGTAAALRSPVRRRAHLHSKPGAPVPTSAKSQHCRTTAEWLTGSALPRAPGARTPVGQPDEELPPQPSPGERAPPQLFPSSLLARDQRDTARNASRRADRLMEQKQGRPDADAVRLVHNAEDGRQLPEPVQARLPARVRSKRKSPTPRAPRGRPPQAAAADRATPESYPPPPLSPRTLHPAPPKRRPAPPPRHRSASSTTAPLQIAPASPVPDSPLSATAGGHTRTHLPSPRSPRRPVGARRPPARLQQITPVPQCVVSDGFPVSCAPAGVAKGAPPSQKGWCALHRDRALQAVRASGSAA
eukprot:TRINITY_DN1260_c0_g1_i2.p1 TRINITY_DN1260_c0_g1~~TRINITY_DN1260_c0_g1_i2.p1  ORF type:complete len:1461 (+),score=170.27 TRINITY_DN1260_c0_g1_i2:52-4434(+)